jgi:hypothetical protein
VTFFYSDWFVWEAKFFCVLLQNERVWSFFVEISDSVGETHYKILRLHLILNKYTKL